MSKCILGEEADRLLEIARNDDDSAWLPLSDVLDEAGHHALARLARGDGSLKSLLVKVQWFLSGQMYDPEMMTVVIQVPPFSVDRRWLMWKTLEVKSGWYNRAAIIMKGARP